MFCVQFLVRLEGEKNPRYEIPFIVTAAKCDTMFRVFCILKPMTKGLTHALWYQYNEYVISTSLSITFLIILSHVCRAGLLGALGGIYQEVAWQWLRLHCAKPLSRQSAHRWMRGCQTYAPAALYPPESFLVLIYVRS
jgi:hypothetical protein